MKLTPPYIFACLVLLFCINKACAQNAWIDSVKKALKTQKGGTGQVATLLTLSDAYRFSQPDSSLAYAQQALSLAENLHVDTCIFWSITAVSGSLYVMGNYALELGYAFKAQELSKKLNTPYTVGLSNGMLSDCYYNLEDYSTSLQYWRRVITIAEQNLPGELFRVYGNASHIFSSMHQFDSALLYAQKSYSVFKQAPLFKKDSYESKFCKSNIFICMADALAGKGYYDSSLIYYRLSIAFSTNIGLGPNMIDACNGMAIVYKEKTNFDSALWFAKRALAEKITNSYPVGMLKAANLLAEIYKTKHSADSALKYVLIASAVKDSLFSREKTTAFQNIIFKEHEKQKEVEAAKIKIQSEYRMYFVIAVLIILLIVTGIFIKHVRQKQLQNMRNSIADDLHDDIGSTLSSISIMNELAKAKSPAALPLLTSIGESTAFIQENMSDIVWAVKTGNDRFENVLQRMNRFATEILEPKNIALYFKSDDALAALKLTMEQRKNLYLFFKEAVNNAAKHSGATKVIVLITRKGYFIEMNISDNGRGFDTTKIYAGNGMGSLKKRAAGLNAIFNITSAERTTVQLKFKIA
jgi:signal transduction histidine kinase